MARKIPARRALRALLIVALFVFFYTRLSTDSALARLLRVQDHNGGEDDDSHDDQDGQDAGAVFEAEIHEPEDISKNFAKPAPAGKRNLKIGVATINTAQNSYMQLSLSDKQAYTRRHGYGFHVDFELGPDPKKAALGAVWHKLTLVEQMIRSGHYEWIWWVDFDTLITNHNVKLEDIIHESLENHPKPESVDMLLTADCFALNAGVMMFRANERVLKFFERVWKCGFDNHNDNEQDCIRKLVTHDIEKKVDGALFIPQWKMNAFPPVIGCRDKDDRAWEKGMFLIHFAGAWAHIKQKDPYGVMMRAYERGIIR